MNDRHQRVESLIRETVAKFIQEEANADPLITVTRVTTSLDYKQMTVHFTTIPSSKESIALTFLRRNGTALRSYVKKRSNLKSIPFFDFSVDYGERHRQNIDEIAREIAGK